MIKYRNSASKSAQKLGDFGRVGLTTLLAAILAAQSAATGAAVEAPRPVDDSAGQKSSTPLFGMDLVRSTGLSATPSAEQVASRPLITLLGVIEGEAQEAFFEADFQREIELRRQLIALHETMGAIPPIELARRKSTLRRVQRILQFPEEKQSRVAEARQALQRANQAVEKKRRICAIAEYRDALNIYTTHLGEHYRIVGRIEYNIGKALHQLDRNNEAIVMLEKAARSCWGTRGTIISCAAFSSLCTSHAALGQFDDAEQCGKRACELAIAGWGETSNVYAIALFNLAGSYMHNENYREALPLFSQVESFLAHHGMRYKVMQSFCQAAIARCLAKTGRPKAAAELYNTILRQHESFTTDQRGQMPFSRRLACQRYAAVLSKIDRGLPVQAPRPSADIITVVAESTPRLRLLKGTELSKALTLANGVASYFFNHANFEAERTARRCIVSALSKCTKPGSVDLVEAKGQLRSVEHVLALDETSRRKIVEARGYIACAGEFYSHKDPACIAEYKKALAIYKVVLGNHDALVPEIDRRLGLVFIAFDRDEQAISAFDEALRLNTEIYGSHNSFKLLKWLCIAHENLERYEISEQYALRAARAAASGWGNDSEYYAEAIFRLANARYKSGQLEKAASTCQKARQLYVSLGPQYIKPQILLDIIRAVILIELKHSQQAIVVFERALRMAEQFPGNDPAISPAKLPTYYAVYAKALKQAGYEKRAEKAMKKAKLLLLTNHLRNQTDPSAANKFLSKYRDREDVLGFTQLGLTNDMK